MGCLCLFLTVPWVSLWSVIVVFHRHTHLIFLLTEEKNYRLHVSGPDLDTNCLIF